VSLYLVLEGPDGGGKSTQGQRICDWLEQRGQRVCSVREPGSTPVGERLRQSLLDPDGGDMLPLTEALLFYAARAELVRAQIAPALRAGKVVVAERCYLSTWVYQGLAHDDGLPLSLQRELTERAHGSCMPDRIYVFDVPPALAAERRRHDTDDRIEARGESFQERVRAGYLELAATEDRIEVVDAAGDAETVHSELTRRVAALLEAVT